MNKRLVITHNTVYSLIVNDSNILDRINIKKLQLLELAGPTLLKSNVDKLIEINKIKLSSEQSKRYKQILNFVEIIQKTSKVKDITDELVGRSSSLSFEDLF